MFDQATTMGDGNHRCGPNPLCPDRMETKCRAEIGSRSPVQSSSDPPGTSASTPTSSSEDGHDKLLGVDPDYCRRILVRGEWKKTIKKTSPCVKRSRSNMCEELKAITVGHCPCAHVIVANIECRIFCDVFKSF